MSDQPQVPPVAPIDPNQAGNVPGGLPNLQPGNPMLNPFFFQNLMQGNPSLQPPGAMPPGFTLPPGMMIPGLPQPGEDGQPMPGGPQDMPFPMIPWGNLPLNMQMGMPLLGMGMSGLTMPLPGTGRPMSSSGSGGRGSKDKKNAAAAAAAVAGAEGLLPGFTTTGTTSRNRRESSAYSGNYNEGKWTEEEKLAFKKAYYALDGEHDWVTIAERIGTRHSGQVRSHFQKFQKDLEANIDEWRKFKEEWIKKRTAQNYGYAPGTPFPPTVPLLPFNRMEAEEASAAFVHEKAGGASYGNNADKFAHSANDGDVGAPLMDADGNLIATTGKIKTRKPRNTDGTKKTTGKRKLKEAGFDDELGYGDNFMGEADENNMLMVSGGMPPLSMPGAMGMALPGGLGLPNMPDGMLPPLPNVMTMQQAVMPPKKGTGKRGPKKKKLAEAGQDLSVNVKMDGTSPASPGHEDQQQYAEYGREEEGDDGNKLALYISKGAAAAGGAGKKGAGRSGTRGASKKATKAAAAAAAAAGIVAATGDVTEDESKRALPAHTDMHSDVAHVGGDVNALYNLTTHEEQKE